MKISILLPYKENYNFKEAGAVSLFVKQISSKSKYSKSLTVYGNTNSKNILSKNYTNVKLNRNILKSSTKIYVENFLKIKNILNSNIIEVHNRPSYIKYIKKKFQNKIFLYFHNDPLSLRGSLSVNERLKLIKDCDKLIFNSNWSKKRFFLNIPSVEIIKNKIFVCHQSSDKIKINFQKKEKIISFVGKLNFSKGYDVFGKSILKILKKYPDWKAVVFGDELRSKIEFKHKNLIYYGFKENKFILNYLKKVSISVTPSRWQEPFGRSNLEASSRGCATIITNHGGLLETSNSSIVLNRLNVTELKKEIEKLINDKNLLLRKQKENYKNFFLTHDYISKKIDQERLNSKEYFFNRNKTIFKIMHITNFNNRFDGRLHYNTSKRINNGFIRLGHNVLSISDRDVVNQNKTFGVLKGINYLQKTIKNNIENFKPDLIVLGHADGVNNETLDYIKSRNIKTTQWFLDPIGKNTPDNIKNKIRLIEKSQFLDTSFITTDPGSLNFRSKNTFFIPNPADPSFEVLNNFKNKNDFDLFFALSHGAHRGILKKGKFDERETFIKKLIIKNKNIKFDIYGINNSEPIWGDNFINNISKSSMGLNLSRGEPVKYYSSDRIVQLMGNGLLTFINHKTFYSDFFNRKEIVTYKNLSDLSYLLQKYKRDDKERKLIAKNGKKKYMKYFNSNLVCQYMIEKTFESKLSKEYLWLK